MADNSQADCATSMRHLREQQRQWRRHSRRSGPQFGCASSALRGELRIELDAPADHCECDANLQVETSTVSLDIDARRTAEVVRGSSLRRPHATDVAVFLATLRRLHLSCTSCAAGAQRPANPLAQPKAAAPDSKMQSSFVQSARVVGGGSPDRKLNGGCDERRHIGRAGQLCARICAGRKRVGGELLSRGWLVSVLAPTLAAASLRQNWRPIWATIARFCGRCDHCAQQKSI